ncbi:MAG: hypothetical protein EXS63_07250 [Candidatus Omnitrophica bacterium]|nr:hypothetical protein [Candidatus Omnitrophota bacterium]
MGNKESVWEDLVNDYLEISSDLKGPERHFLIQSLKKENLNASSIVQYPSFQVADKLVVICREPYKECWFYQPGKKRIGKKKREK